MDKIKTLCMLHNVKTLFAFGSVCTDKFNDNSDIDLLISFQPMDYGDYADTYFDLADKFEKLFKRPVDLVTEKSLSNPYFLQILLTRQRLYFMDNEIRKYLFDIQDSIDSIEKYLEEKHDFNVYIRDKMLRRAVQREFEIIGEAMSN